MLNGTGDTHSHVQLRRNDLAGLTYLQFVGRITGVNGRTRGTHGRTHLLSQAEDDLKVFCAAQRASTRYHLRRGLQVRTVAFGLGDRHKTGVGRQRRIHAHS